MLAGQSFAHTAKGAHGSKTSIKVSGGKRCITGNGLPNHDTGSFPNRGNPNSISSQRIRLCVTTSPRKGSSPRQVNGSIGVGVNGVQFRPGTADYYDPSSRRGFSRNPASGWRLDGLGARRTLGMDSNNAHVDNRGLYHYHGFASALTKTSGSTLIGWAADGFEIHYLGNKRRSSYRLKKGTRPSGPGGRYDGKYVQDWAYVRGSGNLDQCNGGTLNGKFVYFATNTFPFLPHCLWGRVSSDFRTGGGGAVRNRGPRQERGQRSAARQGGFLRTVFGQGRRPPRQAIRACASKSDGNRCSFRGRGNDRIEGICRNSPRGDLVCAPRRR